MDERTLAALKKSLYGKWHGIRFKGGEDKGPDNCELCNEFYDVEDDELCCRGCPVYNRTGFSRCVFTPYDEWERHHLDTHSRNSLPCIMRPDCAECIALADKQIAFLESLLPGTPVFLAVASSEKSTAPALT